MLRRLLYVILNFTFIGILSVTTSDMARAEVDNESANYWLPFCRHVVAGNFDQGDAFLTVPAWGPSLVLCMWAGPLVSADRTVRPLSKPFEWLFNSLTNTPQERMRNSRP
jgi:hypothetical protein